MSETFEEFKKSFSYGRRSDLLFKFVKNLTDDDAAGFFQELYRRIGDALDDGDFDRVVEHVYETQVRAYQPQPGAKLPWTYDDSPFTPLDRPLSECRVALLSSGGHFVAGHDPEPLGVKNMTQEEAEARIGEFLKARPDLTEVPVDTPRDQLRVRHGGYDVRGATADPNVVLPLDALKQAEADGTIGALHPLAYTFVGATAQKRLLKESGPKWIERFRDAGVDAVVMVPV